MLDIIITVYNVEKYLEKCLESFVKQYNGRFNIFLIDDGSNDGSSIICDNYSLKYSFIKAFHKENGGVSSARNYGIRKINNDYVTFFDADDYPSDDYIKKVFEALLSKKNDLFFIEDYRFIDGRNKDGIYIKSQIKQSTLNKNNKILILKHLLRIKRMRVSAWGMVVRTKLITNYNLFFEEGIALEDVEWAPKIIMNANSFCLIKGPIYCYRVRNESLSHSLLNEWKIDSFLRILNELASQRSTFEYQWFLNGYLCNFYLQVIMLFSKQFPASDLPNSLKEYAWLLKYGKNFRCKVCRLVFLLFGMKGLMFLFRRIKK